MAPAPEGGSEAPPATGGPPAASQPTVKRQPESVKTYSELLRACNIDFHLQPKQVLAELNVSNQSELTESPLECYIRIAAVHGQQPQE